MVKRKTPRKTAKKKTPAGSRKKPSGRPGKKKPARRKTQRAAGKRQRLPLGYLESAGGLLIPAKMSEEMTPVPPAKIRSGLSKARTEIQKLMEALSELTEGYAVSEIELAASFNADGKFLGIGVGGATTIKVRFRPEENGGLE